MTDTHSPSTSSQPIVPVILAGGSGTRLWPVSRELHPKQLLPLITEKSMLEETVARVSSPAFAPPVVVCNDDHRFIIAEQLRRCGIESPSIILEPAGRNTAPAVAVAALEAGAVHGDPLLLVLPADHLIADTASFLAAVEAAAVTAGEGNLITFGIVPTSAETGYGYIKAGAWRMAHGARNAALPVESFVEKPDAATAARYVASGDYFWNSGMFLFRASAYLRELETFAPDIAASCRAAHAGGTKDIDFLRVDEAAFAGCRSDSIDYAVMEKTDAALVLPLDAGWNDIGSWSALWEVGARDADGNVVKGDVLAVGMRNCYVNASSRLVATIGIEDAVIVEMEDAVLVSTKERVQEVKSLVSSLNRENRPEARVHRKVYRPWGAYQTVDFSERFQVKRITVNPGAQLSLQMHHHRAEHWVVVKGTARVTRGDEVMLLAENQSTYIPVGVSHRLENPGVIPLELIEVQSGSYLGEDDIVRFQDVYGR